ncbi:MAG: protoporphyrinogen oxidase [Fibrobacteria bacterium]
MPNRHAKMTVTRMRLCRDHGPAVSPNRKTAGQSAHRAGNRRNTAERPDRSGWPIICASVNGGGNPLPENCPIIPQRIAVLGGGMTGLSAAFWLSRLMPNASVTLYEKQDRLGGLVGTRTLRGRLLETGPLAFPSAAPATRELIEACGIGGRCETFEGPGNLGLWVGRRIVPFSRTVAGILKARLLSPSNLLRLLAEPFISKGSRADESVAEFFRRRTGPGFMESIMEPMSAGILAGDPDRMSMAANFPMLHSLERRWGSLARGLWERRRSDAARKVRAGSGQGARVPGMMAGAAGNQAIVDALAEAVQWAGVRIRLSAEVLVLRRSASGDPELEFAEGSGPEAFDFIVACIPPGRLAAIYSPRHRGILSFLEGVPYAPIALGYLSYRKRDMSRSFAGEGCLVQGRTGLGILSLFLPSRMFTGRCPESEELVRVMAGGARSRAVEAMEDAEVRELSIGAVERILTPRGAALDFTCIRHREALPQLDTGHPEALAAAKARLESEFPGLVLAGTGYAGAGIENAVREGKQAAQEVAKRILRHA